jgi:hypothetical protein
MLITVISLDNALRRSYLHVRGPLGGSQSIAGRNLVFGRGIRI